jgi:hypothetical protein
MAMYVTAAMTGLRQGELLALRWRDVDWSARKLRVSAGMRNGKRRARRGRHRRPERQAGGRSRRRRPRPTPGRAPVPGVQGIVDALRDSGRESATFRDLSGRMLGAPGRRPGADRRSARGVGPCWHRRRQHHGRVGPRSVRGLRRPHGPLLHRRGLMQREHATGTCGRSCSDRAPGCLIAIRRRGVGSLQVLRQRPLSTGSASRGARPRASRSHSSERAGSAAPARSGSNGLADEPPLAEDREHPLAEGIRLFDARVPGEDELRDAKLVVLRHEVRHEVGDLLVAADQRGPAPPRSSPTPAHKLG